MPSLTALQLIDMARERSPFLRVSAPPDGALLRELEARQRTILLRYAGAIEGLVNTTIDLATTISGTLVGSSNGVPVYITLYADGWSTHQTANGVPYWNFTEAKIAGDPFGQHGGIPGFPLPSDLLKLIKAGCTYNDLRVGPINIIPEAKRYEHLRRSLPSAFVSGNRLVPVRMLASGNSGDLWDSGIASLQLSYVPVPVVASLDTTITLPDALAEVLIAQLADYLATITPGVSGADKARLSAERQMADQALSDFSVDMTSAASTASVTYRR